MKNWMKRALSMVLVLMMAFGLLPFANLFPVREAEAKGKKIDLKYAVGPLGNGGTGKDYAYDPSKACNKDNLNKAYQKKDSLCAQFVADCLMNGGISFPNKRGSEPTSVAGYLAGYLVNFGYAEYIDITGDENKAKNTVAVGDLIMVCTKNDNKTGCDYDLNGPYADAKHIAKGGLHIIIVTALEKNAKGVTTAIRYYGHNTNRKNVEMSISSLVKYHKNWKKNSDHPAGARTILVHMHTKNENHHLNSYGKCTYYIDDKGNHVETKQNNYKQCEYCEHKSFDDDDVCKGCKKYVYYEEHSVTRQGTAKPAEGTSFYIHDKPLSKSQTILNHRDGFWDKLIGYVVRKVSNDYAKIKQAKIIKEAKNHYGNTWYYVKDANNYEGWAYSDKISITWPVNITFSDSYTFDRLKEGKNDSNKTLTAGDSSVTVKGKVQEENGNGLSMVAAAIIPRQNLSTAEMLQLTQKKSPFDLMKSKNKYYKEKNLDGANSFDLNGWDDSLLFSQLDAGDYVFIVAAKAENGNIFSKGTEFHVNPKAAAKPTYAISFVSDIGGFVQPMSVTKGSSFKLPSLSASGYRFLGWSTDPEATTGKTGNYTPTGSDIMYAVWEVVGAPAKPVLTATVNDIAEGDTAVLLWNTVSGATGYNVYIKDEAGNTVRTLKTDVPSVTLPFPEAGTYRVFAEAYNNSTEGPSDLSENCVTYVVHPPVQVIFKDDADNIYSVQTVSFGGTVQAPPASPAKKGYTFSGWEEVNGADKDLYNINIAEDTEFVAAFTPIEYKVRFYDYYGELVGDPQIVTYDGDEPGAAVPPAVNALNAPEGYMLLGWDTNAYEAVTADIDVHPSFIWGNENLPITIEISNVTDTGTGYWVYYTVTNHSAAAQLGRVVISGKTSAGKFLTQTESGAFYLAGGDGQSYSGNMYVPVSVSDQVIMRTVEAYVVDSYRSTKPIAAPATYTIMTAGESEYTPWMGVEDWEQYQGDKTGSESKTQYRYSNQQVVSVAADSYLDWLEVPALEIKEEGTWSVWSDWQDEPITETFDINGNKIRKVETQEVEDVPAHTEYRYMRYYGLTKSDGKIKPLPTLSSAQSVLQADTIERQTTGWLTTRAEKRIDPSDGKQYYMQYKDPGEGNWDKETSGGYHRWYEWYINTSAMKNVWYGEETRQVDATYKTQYRSSAYTEGAVIKTFIGWTPWSEWSDTVYTQTSTRQVQQRQMFRAKISATSGDTYRFNGTLEDAAGKQALLTVYKVDSASDYSNEYIEQTTIGADGSYDFVFDTYEKPTGATGDFTVTLTVEGSTNPLCLGTIEVPESEKRHYKIRFADEVTGQWIEDPNAVEIVNETDAQLVTEGGTAIAPEVPAHEGYIFLGWNTGLGNVREDMTVTARYVKKTYCVVFVDAANFAVSMVTDVPYGSAVVVPNIDNAAGYRFIGWSVPEGMSLDAVTGHMVVVARYEQIEYTVKYIPYDAELDANGRPIAVAEQTLPYGAYPVNYFLNEGGYDEEDWEGEDEDENENGLLAAGLDDEEEELEEDLVNSLNIPDNMYLAGWNQEAYEPLTGNIQMIPILYYEDDAPEAEASVEPGVYTETQLVSLFAEGEDITIEYKLVNASLTEEEPSEEPEVSSEEPEAAGDDSEDDQTNGWSVYNEDAPISITESCTLYVRTSSEETNSTELSFDYIIADPSVIPAAPQGLTAVQTDEETVTVSWNEVTGATGYYVNRYNDAGFDGSVMTADTSYADGALDDLVEYTYSVTPVTVFGLGANEETEVQINGTASEDAKVFFYGVYTPVSQVSISPVSDLTEGSAAKLTATVTPFNAYETSVTWGVEDGTGIADISPEGVLVAKSEGTVNVTAYANDGSGLSDTVTVTITNPISEDSGATLTVSSTYIRKGSTADVSVSLSENSNVSAFQFALHYDADQLTLDSCTAGAGLTAIGTAPDINTSTPGIVYVAWDDIVPYNGSGSLIDLKFSCAENIADSILTVEIPTNTDDFAFYDYTYHEIDVNAITGLINVQSFAFGDVNMDEKVNVMDANMVRRYAAKLITLEEYPLLLADVSNDGKVNILDANLIRRYVAKLIDVFPADEAA